MSDEANPLGYAAWAAFGIRWVWGRVTKRTEATVTVQERHDFGGGCWSSNSSRLPLSRAVLFANAADAAALCKAIRELNDREEQTCRQYADKRRALIDAAKQQEAGQ